MTDGDSANRLAEEEGFWREVLQKYGRGYWYDPNDQTFHSAKKTELTIQLPEFKTALELDFSKDWTEQEFDEEQSATLGLADHPMLIIFAEVVTLPSFKQWLAGKSGKEKGVIVADTLQVMRSVFELLAPENELPEATIQPNFMTISAQFDAHGNFLLNTSGYCACMGPSLYSHHADARFRDQLDGPSAYELHNVDTSIQEASLYAGAGYIGWLAREELS